MKNSCLAVTVLLSSLVVAACGSQAPTPVPTSTAAPTPAAALATAVPSPTPAPSFKSTVEQTALLPSLAPTVEPTALPTPTPTLMPAPTPTPAPEQVDYLVTDESSICPIGGPIFRVIEGQASIVAQGGLLQKPRGGVVDADGKYIVADAWAGLMKVDLDTGAVSQIAARPPYSPRDVKIDAQGNYIVVDRPTKKAQFAPPAVYRVSPGGEVSIIAQGSPLVLPHGLAIDHDGNYIVGDSFAGVIRVNPQGQMTVVVPGHGNQIFVAADLAVDASGYYIVVDKVKGNLLRVTPEGRVTIIHGGSPFTTGSRDTRGGPRGVAVDGEGNYIVVDEGARALFHVTPQGQVTTIFEGDPLCGPADLNIVSRREQTGATPTPAPTPIPAPTATPRVPATPVVSHLEAGDIAVTLFEPDLAPPAPPYSWTSAIFSGPAWWRWTPPGKSSGRCRTSS